MPKQLNVNLSFTADTAKAQAELRNLQVQLKQLTANAGHNPLGLTSEITNAITETTKLQTALQKATSSTGKLDLGQFKQELNKANLDATKIANTLSTLGPEGQAAFAKLAQSVSLAEVPIRKTNTLLTEFATTLKNTVRWQFSSSILHSFIGNIQSAYGYAQDLNESLTNIRIVTGQSSEQMADFARQANKAAKELSTTTTAYTDAALIFYQQGLTGTDVTDRTDTVIKMANVTGQSAEEVSSYMTAIWNNFDDGSVSLEHYADVITALGATTASSSAEIAEGLSKFASVADTIGLSYDYATSILAALVANTRQSADVIGTSLKTILARLQSVKLGETLDDGTELTKYTQALQTIGVSIFDLNGNMKDADEILEDTAAKWNTLTKAQQAGVAQTVAGTRQYAQFIAMMENWGDVQKNLETSQNAEGTLQDQADIYAESWEAASKRARAAMQSIYDELLNDKFFINITDGFTTIVTSIDNIMQAMGGLQGVLSMVGGIILKMFGSDIATAMDNFVYNIKIGTEAGRQAILEERQKWNQELMAMADTGMISGSAQVDIYREQANIQSDLIAKTAELQSKNKDITSEEEMQLNYLMDINTRMGEQYTLAAQNLEELKAQTTELENQVYTDSFKSAKINGIDVTADDDAWNNEIKKIEEIQHLLGAVTSLKSEFINIKSEGGQAALQGIIEKLENYQSESNAAEQETYELREALESLKNSNANNLDKNLEKVNQAILNLQRNSKKSFNDLISSIEGTDEETKQLVKDLKALSEHSFKLGTANTQAAKAENNHAASVDNLKQRIAELEGTVATTSQRIVAMGSSLTSFSMLLNNVKGIVDTINNPDLSGWEKFVAILGSVGMTITMSLSMMKQLNTAIGVETTALGVLNAQHAANIAIRNTDTISRIGLITLIHKEAIEKTKTAILNRILNETEIKINGSRVVSVAALSAEQKALLLQMYATEADTIAIEKATVAQNAFNSSLLANPLTLVIVLLAGATAALVTYSKAQEKALENTIAANNESIEITKKKIEETDANIALYNSYLDLNAQVKNGKIAQEEFESSIDSVLKQIDAEAYAIGKLTGNYDNLTESIKQAKTEALEGELEDAKQLAEDTENNILPQGRLTDAGALIGDTYTVSISDIEGIIGTHDKYDTQAKEYLSKYVDGFVDHETKVFTSIVDANDTAAIVEQYNQYVDALEAMEDAETGMTATERAKSSVYQNTKKYVEEMKDTVEEYRQALEKVVELETKIEMSSSNDMDFLGAIEKGSLSDFASARENLIKYMEESEEYEGENIEEIANQYIQSLGDEAASYLDNLNIVEGLVDKFGEEYRDNLTSLIGRMSEEDMTILLEMGIDEVSSVENLETYIARAKAIAQNEEVEMRMGTISDVQDSLNSSKDLTNKQQEVLQENFSSLGMEESWTDFNAKDRIDQMATLSDLSDKLIEKNQEYIESLIEEGKEARQQKAADEERTAELLDRLEELKKQKEDLGESNGSIGWLKQYDAIETEIGEIDRELEELSNKEYNIDIDLELVDDAIFTTFETKVNDIISQADALKTAAELVGEGWLVAAEDAQKLADVYPELMEGAQVLADGTIQLNKEKVNTILAGNSAIIASDKDAAAAQLESQIALLDAEIEYQQTKLQILQNLLEGKINETDAEKALQEAESKFEEQCIDTVGKADANATNQEVANHIAATDINLQNLDIIDQRIAEISQHYSKMLSGEIVTASTSSGAVGGGTASYTSGNYTASITDDDLTNTTVEEIKAQIQATQDTLDALQDQRADYTALLAKLRAGADNAIEAMDGVQSGKAGKEKKSGKEKEHKIKDLVDKFEADPFHKVNQELEDIEHNLNMINKQQSHMFGKELINNLKQQNAQLKRQTELHREKLAIAQQEANALRSQLQIEGVVFDGDNIANYNAMLQAAENQINALIDQYNALSAAEQEAWDNAAKSGNDPIKQAEKYYEELKKQMDKYTDYMSTVYSEEEAIQDALFQQIENNLKAYQVEIELKLDMSEARRAMNKFLKDMSTDIKNMYKTSAEWATTFYTSEKDAGTYKDDINTKLKQLEDYKNASVGGADDMFATESEKYKAITDLEKEILEDSENLLNEYQTAYDNLRDAFGEVADQFNEILDQFDTINDTLDHYAKVIELLYGGETDNGREQLAEIYSLQKENSLARQDAMRKWGDELQKRRAEALAKGYDEDDSYIKDIDAQIEENSKNLESEIENYIDTIQKELENSIKMAQSQMDKSIWGTSIADTRQEWDDKKAMADGYYDSVEKIYQLESLESKWKAAITNTSSLKAQQQLAAIMDKQVASLESKNALSEKDIELAEKELAVYQAQIALEEAQNNKNSMKLTRDAAGNWSYQYVADASDIEDKQQSYLDKTNEWRTASINAAEEITERIMDVYETFSERMTAIMNDVTLSEEEKDAKIASLNETYFGENSIITKLVEDSNYIQSTANRATYIELAGLYNADKTNFERMTEAEKTLIENMNAAGILSYESLKNYVIGDDGKSGIYGEIYNLCKQTNENSSAAWKSMAADAINRMYKDPDSVSNTIKQAYADMENALKIYNKAIEDSVKASGIEWSKVGLQLDGVQQKIGDTANKIDDITDKLGDLSAFEDAVLRIKEMWDETAGSIRQATSDLQNYLNLLANSNGGGGSGSTGSGEGSTGGSDTSKSSSGDGNLTVGETVTYTGGLYYEDSYGNGKSGSRGPGKKVKVTQIKEDGRPYPIHVKSSDSAYGWLTKGQLSGYDTGGYTGDWAGGDGRLALLHHKELVLNKEDTENILNAVNMVRELNISSILSSIDDNIKNCLSNLIGGLLGLCTKTFNGAIDRNQNSTDNTTINVEAVFPSANSVEDIREAILSLPNYASQIKMRK